MTDQHTPGPWVLEDRGYKFIVHKPGDGYVTRDVCRLDSSTMAAFNQAANARLIAAAPDLLEFARAVVRYAGSAGDDYLADKARAAIDKAIGASL